MFLRMSTIKHSCSESLLIGEFEWQLQCSFCFHSFHLLLMTMPSFFTSSIIIMYFLAIVVTCLLLFSAQDKLITKCHSTLYSSKWLWFTCFHLSSFNMNDGFGSHFASMAELMLLSKIVCLLSKSRNGMSFLKKCWAEYCHHMSQKSPHIISVGKDLSFALPFSWFQHFYSLHQFHNSFISHCHQDICCHIHSHLMLS